MHTDKWNARRCDRGHELAVLGEIFVAVNSHFASAELRHVSLANLLPCPLESANWRCVQSRGNRNHGGEVVETSATLW